MEKSCLLLMLVGIFVCELQQVIHIYYFSDEGGGGIYYSRIFRFDSVLWQYGEDKQTTIFHGMLVTVTIFLWL